MTDHPRDFETMLKTLRPALHRYCARMTGSTIDGEDVVQEALLKAVAGREAAGALDNPEGWLFRIAHNCALDFLRRRKRAGQMGTEEELAMVAAPVMPDPDIAAAGLRTFLRLPALQRGSVILKDVLGHSLGEIATITEASEPAVKSALQRGRARLRELAAEAEDAGPPALSEPLRERLTAYVEGFRAGDFDAVRAMLADDVRLDLVATLHRRGKSEVGQYYGAYDAARARWAYAAATVEGRPAMLVYERAVSMDAPAYFVVLDFEGGQVVRVHDFLYARYAMEGAVVRLV
ncbi:MAG: sigma-70 family RNA polymerase sigma factor [Caulobacter sp.]|nr:sigma-70 family RNA polymerase sigma factor [Caulobacter sp.]